MGPARTYRYTSYMDMWSKIRPMYLYVYVLWCVYTISLIGVLTHTDTHRSQEVSLHGLHRQALLLS